MKHEDIIAIRGIIERYEELVILTDINAHEVMPGSWEEHEKLAEERGELENILAELKGYGGDEQWRGDWYPSTLIREEYFTEYAKELLEDCGDIPRNLPKYIAIDWEQTATNIQVDYSIIKIDGHIYFYRG
jgi:hypothetical protein